MVDRIMAWFRNLPKRLLDWWEKFSKKQKITIVVLALATVAAFVALIVWVTRPEYITIHTAQSAKEAQEVIDLLNENEIVNQTSEDGLVISINRKDYTKAVLLLGSNSISTDAFTIENVTSGGFFSTEADTQKRYVVYLEQTLEQTLQSQDFVRTAIVKLTIPEQNGTLIAQNKESYAAVTLDLINPCSVEQAAGMARLVATALGNDTTNNITIMDTKGSLLYAGADSTSTFGAASSQVDLQNKISNDVRNEVIRVLAATKQFSSIDAAVRITLDISETNHVTHTYSNTEEEGDGVLASRDTYHSVNQGQEGGVPGTDSNTTETGYVYETGGSSMADVTETSEDFVPDEDIVEKYTPAGSIDRENSFATITLLTYNIIREDDARERGDLEGVTWDQYKLANDVRRPLEVEQDWYQAVSTATGIPVKNVTILSFEEPFFVGHEGMNISRTDIMQIILIVLILGLLLFVILRSMRQAKVEEAEPEISIDEILQSTIPEEELGEIGVEEKSEARRIVEKFVQDNPELAANLLRNWLNEDWD
ncbi:MAG: flagellar M-ring protein FliF [Lachnospiraceae bacterium]|nr:flagellar M-ring protein FliF [Lachnospiraceae bacterium]